MCKKYYIIFAMTKKWHQNGRRILPPPSPALFVMLLLLLLLLFYFLCVSFSYFILICIEKVENKVRHMAIAPSFFSAILFSIPHADNEANPLSRHIMTNRKTHTELELGQI